MNVAPLDYVCSSCREMTELICIPTTTYVTKLTVNNNVCTLFLILWNLYYMEYQSYHNVIHKQLNQYYIDV